MSPLFDRRRRAFIAAGLGGLALPAKAARAPATERAALPVRRPTHCALLAVARAGQRLVAAGERGVVISSDDAGQTWAQAEVPVSVTLTSLAFTDARHGWATGHMGVVLRTDDGGRRWIRVLEGRQAAALIHAGASAADAANAEATLTADDAQRFVDEGADKPLLHIAPRADGSLLAVGAYGMALAGRDGGRQWASLMHALPNPDGFSLYGHAERGDELWLYGEQGLLLRADAARPRFQPVAPPSAASLFGSVVLADGTLLLLGLRGRVLRSAAPGAPLEAIATPIDAALTGGTPLADGSVAVVGAAGQLLISRDAGRSFQPRPLPTRFPFADLAAAPDGALVLVGQRGLQRVALKSRST
ncbi:WD40/YVTN/BNR-like repeat-containing protein [Roseateles sp. LKC17W]|uniref:WD40/YVTN/BNR-like repeat-containing protein n=1 Tax=Pelomonas margarita TaxID=3299031 RepID=A0ABW7FI21_9BURK